MSHSRETRPVSAVSIVVLNWRQEALTARCLESLRQLNDAASVNLIVVDNESSDASQQALIASLRPATGDAQFASVVLLAIPQNAGFAAGMNVGIQHALSHQQAQFIWLLNNDVRVGEAALQELLAAAQAHPDWAAVAPRIHGEPTQGETLFGGYRFQPWLSRIRPCLSAADRMDYPAGAALFLRAAALRQAGLLDEGFFLYGEELDLARRYQMQGWQHGCAANAVVWHDAGLSSHAVSPLPGRSPQWAREFFENRSALRLIWRHFRWCLPVAFPVRFGAKMILALRGKRSFTAFLAAVVDLLYGKTNDNIAPAELVHRTVARKSASNER